MSYDGKLRTAEDVVHELLKQRAAARADGDIVATTFLQRLITLIRRRMPRDAGA
jgi:hypothetical protein